MTTHDTAVQIMQQTHLIHNISFHGSPLPGEAWGWGVRVLHLIHFVTHGQGTLEIHGKSFPLSAGQIFYIEPNQLVRYTSSASNPIVYWWVEWYGEGSDRLIKAMGFDREHPVLTVRNSVEVLAAMDALERAQENSMTGALERQGELYRLMACFLRNSTRAEAPAERDSLAHFNTAVNYIRGRLADPDLTVDATAKHVCISRKYLHALFIQYAGKSVNDYIIDARIAMAEELLKLRRLTVSSVAVSVGYNDPFSFSRIFKKRIGMSPSQYAREYQVYDD